MNTFFRYCSTTTTIYYSTKTKHEKKNSTTFYLYCSILFLIYLTPRWHCQKNRLFMSNVTARALPSLKKFSYNDKHDTLTIYYYYKIPCQFCPPARKIPLSPSILYAPPSPLPLLLSNKTENFLLMIESKI
jgi:hypothetical protein